MLDRCGWYGWVAACPDCGPVLGRLYGHGAQTQSFRDTPTRAMPTRLAVRRRRFQCKHCHKTLFEPLPAVSERAPGELRSDDGFVARAARVPVRWILDVVGYELCHAFNPTAEHHPAE